MAVQHTIEQLRTLHLNGMLEGLNQQLADPAFLTASFEQRIQMLVDAEVSHRDTQRYLRILKSAKLKVTAIPEEIDYDLRRGLDKGVVADLLTCSWIRKSHNLIVTGKTGTGKTWLACALAVQAARCGLTVAYRRTGPLLEEMALGHDDGTILRQRKQLAKAQLLIIDDFGLTSLTNRGRADLLELLDERVNSRSTIIVGQMPWKNWYDFIGDPALADAIMDRLIHSSVKLNLQGDSLRQKKTKSGQ